MILAALLLATLPAAVRFEVEILKRPEGPPWVEFFPRDLNNEGVLVGAYDEVSGFRQRFPLWWQSPGPFVTPDANDYAGAVQSYCINDAGQFAGTYFLQTGQFTGWLLWDDPNTPPQVLDAIAGSDGGIGQPRAMNDFGVIVGDARFNGEQHGVVWDPVLGFAELPPLGPNDLRWVAHDIGAGCLVVGESQPREGEQPWAVYWPPFGSVQRVGGQTPIRGVTYGVNRAGDMVGVRLDDPNAPEAFLWADQTLTMLGDVPIGDFGSEARDINADRIVVGISDYDAFSDFAFVWDEGNGMRPLRDLLFPEEQNLLIREAITINDCGEILCAGTPASSGGLLAFVLRPIIPADIDSNGAVDSTDLSLLLREFGDAGPEVTADLNSDRRVDSDDLSILLTSFGLIWSPPCAE